MKGFVQDSQPQKCIKCRIQVATSQHPGCWGSNLSRHFLSRWLEPNFPRWNVGVSENSGFSPQIIHFNRVFHDFHHPFWGCSTVPPLFLEFHPICIRDPRYGYAGVIWVSETSNLTPISNDASPVRKTTPDVEVFWNTRRRWFFCERCRRGFQ